MRTERGAFCVSGCPLFCSATHCYRAVSCPSLVGRNYRGGDTYKWRFTTNSDKGLYDQIRLTAVVNSNVHKRQSPFIVRGRLRVTAASRPIGGTAHSQRVWHAGSVVTWTILSVSQSGQWLLRLVPVRSLRSQYWIESRVQEVVGSAVVDEWESFLACCCCWWCSVSARHSGHHTFIRSFIGVLHRCAACSVITAVSYRQVITCSLGAKTSQTCGQKFVFMRRIK